MDFKGKIIEALNAICNDTRTSTKMIEKYRSTITVLNRLPTIYSIHDLDTLYIPKKVYDKINTIVEKLERIEKVKNEPEKIFQQIIGIGPAKAKSLVKDFNITTLEELLERQNEVLNSSQRKGLEYYGDLQKPIPRSEMDIHNEIIKCLLNEATIQTHIKGDSEYMITGSYRRGEKYSNDIDVVITNDDDNSKQILNLIELMKNKDYLKHIFSKRQTQIVGVVKLDETSPARHINIMWSNRDEYPFLVLHSTGSKLFNTGLKRYIELNNVCSIDEHGIIADDGSYIRNGNIKTENDIFKYLKLPYIPPEDRNTNHYDIPHFMHIF